MTAEGKNLAKSEQFVGKFLDLLPGNSPCATTTWNARLPCVNEAIVVPTPVRTEIIFCLVPFCILIVGSDCP